MKIIRWLPRILSILFIVFISLFALDVFDEGNTLKEILPALSMHLLPALALIVITIIAWKKDLIGGFLFVILAIFFTFFFNTYSNLVSFLLISGPVFLTGALFLLNHYLNKKEPREN